jgi:tetratricopeptide (TPR) repeat protein
MKCIKLLSIGVVLFGITVISSAQTLQEVTEAYNKGAELMAAGDLEKAIAELEKCVELAKAVGEDAEEHQIVAESALPGLYFQVATKLNNARDYSAAVKAFETTITASEKYKNADIKERAAKAIPQIYFAMGVADFQAQKYNEAIANRDLVTARDPNNARAYYIKGVSYQQLKDEPKMEENYKLAIEKGTANNDAASAQSSKSQLSRFHYNAGITARKAQKWDDAIAAFNKTIEVDSENADAYYAMASSYNSKKSYDNAIANAEKALALKSGGDAKALDPIYYELGTSYLEKKDNGKACEYFKKVVNEPFLKGAKHHIDVTLKCK